MLVVDADLRKPSVAAYLALDGLRSPGLSDALRESALRAQSESSAGSKASICGSCRPGPPELAPYELLSSPRLDALMREARRDFDCVLIDTPPRS